MPDAPRAGLCDRCVWRQLVAGARSTFVMCRRGLSDPRFPKYPALPVVACAGFEPPDAVGTPERRAGDPTG